MVHLHVPVILNVSLLAGLGDLKIQLTFALRRSVSKYILSIVTVVDIAYRRVTNDEQDRKGKREGERERKKRKPADVV